MSKKEIKQGDNEVIIDQHIARLRGRLTTTQSRSMLSILKRARDQVLENPNIKVFSIPTDIFLDDIQNKDTAGLSTVIQKLSKHLETLMTKIFIWGTAKKLSKAVFMQEVTVTEDEVKFKFSDYIREHIKPIANVLIVKDFELIQSFRSEYARQLYKHIMMWENKQSLYLSLQDFKDFLGVPDRKSYERMDNLKRKVIDVAINEINEKCPWMELKYKNKTKPRSRKVIGFEFFWKLQPVEVEQPKLFSNKPTIQEQIKALQEQKIYVEGKLFFFQGIRQKEGKYQIIAQDTEKRTVSISTITPAATIEMVKNMMKG